MNATRAGMTPDVAVAYRTGQQRGRALAQLCRFEIGRVPSAIALAAAIAAGWSPANIVATWLVVAGSCAAAAALNDLADLLADTVNGRDTRPLVTGQATNDDVRLVILAGLAVVAVAQLAIPQPNGILVSALGAALGAASATEPIALQRRGFVGPAALAVCYFLLPIALVHGLGTLPTLAPFALLGAAVLAHKDVRDEAGDRAAGKRTPVVRYGARTTAWLALMLAIAGTALLLATTGSGLWLVPAAVVIAALGRLAQNGMRLKVWLAARLALLATAVALALAV